MRKPPCIALALLLLLPGVAAAQSDAPEAEVVVTGVPLSETERRLADCLARKCPPKEDIAATLAHAENLYVAGDYQHARKTLLAARGRNKRFGAQYPIEVGDLLRANARLASLNGQVTGSHVGQIESVEALKAGLPDNDPRVLMQRLEIGGTYLARGQVLMAGTLYRTVAAQARAANLPIVEAIALLRRAVVYTTLGEAFPRYRPTARAAIDAVRATTDPAAASFREGALLLQARLATAEGDQGAVDTAIAQMAAQTGAEPQLLYDPPIDLRQSISFGSRVVKLQGRGTPEFADISYRIAPDGSVTEVEVLRQSSDDADRWIKIVTDALAKRRYARPNLTASSPGLLRVERFSMTYDYDQQIGTRLATRTPLGRLESTDLTVHTRTGAN